MTTPSSPPTKKSTIILAAAIGFAIGFITACCILLLAYWHTSKPKTTVKQIAAASNKHYNGIDVSHHQGTIDWEKVAQDSCIQFVYIKATEGKTYTDPSYSAYIKGAQTQGLKCGSYHYFRMTSTAKEQFDNFKKATKPFTQDLIPMVDVELNKCDKKGWRIDDYHTSKKVAQERDTILSSLRKLLGLFEKEYCCKPMIYCTYASYVQLIKGEFDDYPIFLGRYGNAPGIDNYLIWQYSEKGRIDGIEGYVDLDQFNKGKTSKDISYISPVKP